MDYKTIPMPKMRQLVTDIGWLSRHTYAVHGLLEVDVTVPRQVIREHEAQTGEQISFTGFIVHCVAQAVDEQKAVQTYFDWRGRQVIFDDVDVGIMVEVEAEGHKVPIGYMIRAANDKSLRQIHDEIRGAQKVQAESSVGKMIERLTIIPRFLRRALMALIALSPVWMKRLRGTVAVTSVGMFGRGAGWAITAPTHSLVVAVGSIAEKPGVVDGHIEPREILHLTLSFDHAAVDGAPAARFAARLVSLIEHGHGLDEACSIDLPRAQYVTWET